MKLTVLGSGGAFTMKNYQSNFLITSDEEQNLLVDCGTDIRWSLNEQGYSYKNIDAIYISHLHSDHCGGMLYLGFTKYFDPTQKKPILYISELLVDELWSALRPGMASYQGKILTLNDYFNVVPIKPNGEFIFGMVKFRLVLTVHIMDGFRIVPSFGLMISYMDKKIFFTSDTQFNELLNEFYKQADVILQECETTDYKSGVHCNIKDLLTLPEEYRKKMRLYHYGDNVFDYAIIRENFHSKLYYGDVIDFEGFLG